MSHQPSLFSSPNKLGTASNKASDGDKDGSALGESEVEHCHFYPSFSQWQRLARSALQAEKAPDSLWWQADEQALIQAEATSAKHAEGTKRIRVSKHFLDEARAAACHSNPDRWALLYQLLWRLTHGERHLLHMSNDAEVTRLRQYAKTVRRDVHKMKAFLRFRELQQGSDSRYVAWFEPEHHIVEYAAGFFLRRFTNMRWSILTPERCAHWEGSGKVWFTAGVSKNAAPKSDQLEDAWRVYYANIFNPARLKINAMQSEMPQKYWKNLPEAELIPELIRGAEQRVAAMQANIKTADIEQCGPRPMSPAQSLSEASAKLPELSLGKLALDAAACQGCHLQQNATQTVFGRGSERADIMLIAEQPGAVEDLNGRAFSGPVNDLLKEACRIANLEVEQLYLTYAVKHHKFETKARRRWPAAVELKEIQACQHWLSAEIAAVQPQIIICLGRTAALACLENQIIEQQQTSVLFEHEQQLYLISSALNELSAEGRSNEKQQSLQQFIADLSLAKKHVGNA